FDFTRRVSKIKETGAMLGPTLRWAFLPSWWLEAQALGQRRFYEDHAFNSRVGEGTMSLGWTPSDRLELRMTGAERWRNFVDREQFSVAGRELPETALKIRERNGEVRAEVTWDEAAKWKTATRIMVKE